MTATDLTADRLESIRARAVQGYAPTMRDTLTLVAEVERLRAESVPRSALVQDWRWCKAKDAPEVWEDGNGCLWCTEAADHPRLYVIREDTDA